MLKFRLKFKAISKKKEKGKILINVTKLKKNETLQKKSTYLLILY
jgi:hypothetical protein